MDLAAWRDLIIVVWGSVGVLAIIFICVIIFLFYRKTSVLLESADSVVVQAGEVINYVDKEIIRPVTQVGTMVEGIIKGIGLIREIFRKKEDEDE